ncbi:MAG: sodium:alanine symporter family protein [Gammaproteobacteria bacterium]
MEQIESLLGDISGFIWGLPMLIMLFGVGLYLTFGMHAMPWRKVGAAVRYLWQGRASDGKEGDISPFQALMTALSGAIGTGNIAGVATAIYLGGPGAVFWMWMTALVGMATSFTEGYLAVQYRERDALGNYVGGPMYYIKNGLGKRWLWLAGTFAFLGTFAAFGIGNMVQAHSVSDVMQSTFNIPGWVTGAVLVLVTGAVILGGIKRIAEVAGKLVPLMAFFYIAGALWLIGRHFDAVPAALMLIVTDAFTGTAAAGGFAGAAAWAAIRYGVARGAFSNEAGMGSTPIAHAAARTNDPFKQGLLAMLGTFIDTLIVCTMTALAIILTGVWTSGDTGAPLSALAFETGLPGPGGWIVTFSLMIFAFTTLLAWSYYGERCAEYLFGERIIMPYRYAWLVVIFIGTLSKVGLVWIIAEIMNGLMAVPNLIALAALSPLVFKAVKERLARGDL